MMATDILSLEEFAFSLLNQLADDYGACDDGSFAKAIQETNEPEKMERIIQQLQAYLLQAMYSAIPVLARGE